METKRPGSVVEWSLSDSEGETERKDLDVSERSDLVEGFRGSCTVPIGAQALCAVGALHLAGDPTNTRQVPGSVGSAPNPGGMGGRMPEGMQATEAKRARRLRHL